MVESSAVLEALGNWRVIRREDLGVSKNSDTPKSSIWVGIFHYIPSILGYPYFWKHPFLYLPRITKSRLSPSPLKKITPTWPIKGFEKCMLSEQRGAKAHLFGRDREFWKTSSKQWEWEGWWGWWYTIDSLTRCNQRFLMFHQFGLSNVRPQREVELPNIFRAAVTGKLVKMGIPRYWLHADLPMENAFTLLFPRHIE